MRTVMKSTLLLVGVIGFLAMAPRSAHAFGFNAVALGSLPDGSVVEAYNFMLDPGEEFPWHFHPTELYGVIISGALTEDHGCGLPLEVHNTGDAFHEHPGEVHKVRNDGTVVVNIFISSNGLPSCYGGFNDSLSAPGPVCEGKGKHVESEEFRVPSCTQLASCTQDPNTGLFICPIKMIRP